ncbi:(2Fe-2S)-binding protein [Mycobacterium sp.]|uniref:(2Fe-2S)-binding protein n=1 Tax=Mycobacterium sp. TaxID=1785 RepID=UPI002F0649C4
MYVCLCTGATSHAVADAVARGASTCNEVARACGAGSDCGRCRRTVRSIIASVTPADCAGCERNGSVGVLERR